MTNQEHKAEAEWLSVFGEPTRVAIIRALSTGEKIVTELAKMLKVEVVNISHHLKIMRTAGVVVVEHDGRWRRYSLVGSKVTATEIKLTHRSGTKVTISMGGTAV